MTGPARLVRLLAAASAIAAPAALRAQCPNGSPPPCRVAPARAAPAPPVDSNAVAVLPFVVEGPGASVGWMGTGMVDVLSGALDGVGGWRAISPRTVLARVPRAGLDLAASAQAARALGADQMVSGSAVVVGPMVRLRAELYATATRSRIGAPVEARARADDPSAAMDSLAVGLARIRLGARMGSAARPLEVATTSPPALRAWIAAEDLMRHAGYQEAADSLLQAIARDSGFAPAYYRLQVASTFGADIRPWDGLRALRTAMQYPNRLSQRQRDLVQATLAASERDRFRALDLGIAAGSRYADDAEAAYVEGEAYFHEGLDLGEPPERALLAFERGIALDSTLVDNYNHVAELRYRLGDVEGARALLRTGLALQPENYILHSIVLADRVASGENPDSVVAQVRRERPDPERILIRAPFETLRCLADDPARAIRVAMAIARALQSPAGPRATRANGMQFEAEHLFALGRRREAQDALEAGAALGADVAIDSAVLRLIRTGGADWPAEPLFADTSLSLVVRGVAAVRDGGTRLARGDTAGARTALLEGFRVTPGLASLGLGSLLLARIEFASGSPRVAWQHAQADLLPSGITSLRAEFEELRGMIAERLGDREAAVKGYRNFVALWEHADPELQPRVAAARAALARLGAP